MCTSIIQVRSVERQGDIWTRYKYEYNASQGQSYEKSSKKVDISFKSKQYYDLPNTFMAILCEVLDRQLPFVEFVCVFFPQVLSDNSSMDLKFH